MRANLIIVLMFITGCGVYLFHAEREGVCVAFGKEFGVEAHSVSLLHMRCAADHWPPTTSRSKE